MTPLDYSLCDQTLTIYGIREGILQRRVADNCHLAVSKGLTESIHGKSRRNTFLLIIPGDADLQPGDRVFDGTGPEAVDWQNFVPAFTENLYEVGQVQRHRWNGQVCHVEGREAP